MQSVNLTGVLVAPKAGAKEASSNAKAIKMAKAILLIAMLLPLECFQVSRAASREGRRSLILALACEPNAAFAGTLLEPHPPRQETSFTSTLPRLAEAAASPSRCPCARRQPRPQRYGGWMSEPEIEISIRELTKSFGPQTVLEDITFDVPKGKVTVLLGPSGTGKSVFLKHLVGLLKPDRGEIWIDGKNVPALSEKDLYQVRRKFGVLFQAGALFGSMNVYANVA